MTQAQARLRLERLLAAGPGAGLAECREIGGQHGVAHYRVTLADGRGVFVKLGELPARDPAGFEAEALGLRWLGEAGAVPVPEVLGWDEAALGISWLPQEAPGQRAAEDFGRDLARMHAAGAEAFGAPWPGSIAGLPLPGRRADSWPRWYAAERLLPYARIARDRGSLTAADVRLVEAAAAAVTGIAGPAEAPSRIHGDCWSGNVLWSGGRGWLIDPAAHGGHRETDLAMLALFGAPYLDRIIACYQEIRPLAAGWRERLPLHQLHPLLVHVCLFGGSYRAAALDASRAVLRQAS